jgi:hypothetical protein
MRFPIAFLRTRIQPAWGMLLGAILYRLAVGIHFLQVGGMTAQWTNENAAVARSLLLRHAFAGAYTGYSGPTAWLAPAYTFIVAAVFGVFGINSQSSGAVLLLVNTALSSFTVLVIYKLGHDYFNERVGLIAGWAWALSPLGVLMPLLLWDTSLSAFLFSLGLLVLLRSTSVRQWAVSGAVWGLCALASPALLAPLPAMLVARLWRVSNRWRFGLTFCLTLICVLLPWTARNRMELHAIFPVRSNGWAEIYFGNITFDLHPCARPDGLYQHVGETAFVTQLKRDTIQYVTSHPAQFAGKSFLRAIRFWFVPLNFLPLTMILALACWVGWAMLLRKDLSLAVVLAMVLVFYPIIYSITHIETRYRHPIEPVIYLLAAYAGSNVFDRCAGWFRKSTLVKS